VKRIPAGALVALGGIAALSAAMVPVRTHLSVATPALVLVVPVVAGVALGGIWSGGVAVVAGFAAYDLLFIPPYDTFSVGAAQSWVALGVYVVVVLLVGALVVALQRTRAEARRRQEDTQRLYVLSDLLIGDKHVTELLQLIVSTIHQAFDPRWAAVLLPDDDDLAVVATAGEPLSDDEIAKLSPSPGRAETLRADDGVVRVVLTARERPIGLLAMAGAPLAPHDWELLHTYANQAALALERSQLRERLLHAELLEEVDRWRDALMGAVSHDLRTPLASVKTAVTTLRRSASALSEADREELLELIETQSDALDRLVANLLDMSRIQSGTLELRRAIVPVSEVVEGALRSLGASGVDLDLPADLPPVDVDQVLMEQVLVNLVDNALRHSPDGRPVEVSAATGPGLVEVAVRDHGPGIPASERRHIFQMLNRVSGGGRAGLGLAITKAFVEAHGQTIRVEDAAGGGARFAFTMSAAPPPGEAPPFGDPRPGEPI
jgi:two-component system, OmpR family, sensor histidine kinase KdpD